MLGARQLRCFAVAEELSFARAAPAERGAVMWLLGGRVAVEFRR
jgi:hypothetical protein